MVTRAGSQDPAQDTVGRPARQGLLSRVEPDTADGPRTRSRPKAAPIGALLRRIAPDVKLGQGVQIHAYVNLYGCSIGDGTRIGTFVKIQRNATIGRRCKVSTHTFICEGVTIEDECFIGHHVVFINDRYPRAATADGSLMTDADWTVVPTRVKKGAAIGSGAVILCGLTIGEGALVGAGSVVTRDVPPFTVVAGNPASGQDRQDRRRDARGREPTPAGSRAPMTTARPVAGETRDATIVRAGILTGACVYYLDAVRVNLGLFQSDTDVLWDLAPHDLSILTYLLDETPQSVSATACDHTGSGFADMAYITVHFTGSFIAHQHVNWRAPTKIRQMLIGGSQRMLVYNDMEPSEKVRIYDRGVRATTEDLAPESNWDVVAKDMGDLARALGA